MKLFLIFILIIPHLVMAELNFLNDERPTNGIFSQLIITPNESPNNYQSSTVIHRTSFHRGLLDREEKSETIYGKNMKCDLIYHSRAMPVLKQVHCSEGNIANGENFTSISVLQEMAKTYTAAASTQIIDPNTGETNVNLHILGRGMRLLKY